MANQMGIKDVHLKQRMESSLPGRMGRIYSQVVQRHGLRRERPGRAACDSCADCSPGAGPTWSGLLLGGEVF